MDFEKFFAEEWTKRFREKVPCEEIEDGCEGEEGVMVDGYKFANRLLIWINDDNEIAFFRQDENNETYPRFKLNDDVFVGKTYELVPELAKSWMYPDDVVIFSKGKEIEPLTGVINIGQVIDRIVKIQEEILICRWKLFSSEMKKVNQ